MVGRCAPTAAWSDADGGHDSDGNSKQVATNSSSSADHVTRNV